MAIEKPMEPSDILLEEDDRESDLAIIVEDPETLEVVMDDGSVVVQFGQNPFEDTDPDAAPTHDANLAEHIEDNELEHIASELVDHFQSDRESRGDWASAYIKGLDLLGMKVEERTEPWNGASGVYHPMMTEAVIKFQAQAMGELLPAAGPVRTKIMGKLTTEKYEQAQRVETELNYLITEKMPDYRDEMEQMLFKLPMAGSAFKKIYFDPITERPVSQFVPAEDLVVSYGASNLRTAPRFTHVMKKTSEEILKLQVNGFYRDIELPEAVKDITDIEEKYNELEGSDVTFSDDPRHTILEMHVDLDLPEPFDDENGVALPYVVTIDKSSSIVLAIRRNWYEDDAKREKRMHVVHYPYLPGMGFYGTGLIHTLGGLTKSATSIMRQLIDAGTLSNLPAGFKARGMRITGDNTPIMPGEFRDVDVPAGTIKDSIVPLPYKEPSGVLYSLLGNVVEEGRRVGAVGDIQMKDVNAQAPVGTTLALMERSMQVMSGIQARLHAAMKQELRILARIVHDYMPEEYAYEMDEPANRVSDFDGRVDVIPVSDPNAATMAQRIMQYQAALQLAQQAPQMYNMGKLHRQMLEVLGIQDADDIIALPEDIKPSDPVTENMAILKQEPVKAFAYQDHEAHIQTHMMAMQDPKIQQVVGQSPFASAIQSSWMSHITEHVALQYRVEIQKQLGVELPDPEAPLPEDIELQVSRLVAQAADKLFQKGAAEAAAEQAAAQQQDPLTQIQQRELMIKEKELEHKIEMDKLKANIDATTKSENVRLQQERIDLDQEKAVADIGIRVSELETGQKETATRLALDIAERVNLDD
tara:strand:+ start:2224 stop:4665 length:2442 start_codon:yes stop_codon:yes gene_type:complete